MIQEHLSSRKRLAVNAVALSFCGLAIGWLVGLATSPVIEKVLESILAIVGAAVATLAGVQLASDSESDGSKEPAPPDAKSASRTRIHVNAIPIATFSIFLAVGASVGLAARARDWFSPGVDHFVSEWSSSTNLKKEVLAKVLLGSEYPDLSNAEMRDQLLPILVQHFSTSSSDDTSKLLGAMYPSKRSGGAEDNTHPTEGLGLKDYDGKAEGCKEVVAAKKNDSKSFDLTSQISNKFNTDYIACTAGGKTAAECALKIWSDKCL